MFDQNDLDLADPEGNILYKLSPDAKYWYPVIPADVLAALPAGHTLDLNSSGAWEIKDADGNLLYTWDPAGYQWDQAEVAAIPAEPAETEEPVGTETPAPAEITGTETTEPTESAGTETTGETTEATAGNVSCLAPAPPRLTVGQTARILTNLNMRSDPLIADNILITNLAGEILKILGGPVCVPHEDSAYRWWQVENAAGTSGWSAENFLYGEGYFLEPVQ